MEFYHELTTDIPELPRSYLVIGNSLTFINAVNIIFQIKSRKHEINHLPIQTTPDHQGQALSTLFSYSMSEAML